jgi:hypothetical protein
MKKSILNEENLTHAGLAHKNGFSPAIFAQAGKRSCKPVYMFALLAEAGESCSG